MNLLMFGLVFEYIQIKAALKFYPTDIYEALFLQTRLPVLSLLIF